MNYQWQHAGTNYGSQSIFHDLLFIALPGLEGDWQVIASNSVGQATSAVATLTLLTSVPVVNPPAAPIRAESHRLLSWWAPAGRSHGLIEAVKALGAQEGLRSPPSVSFGRQGLGHDARRGTCLDRDGTIIASCVLNEDFLRSQEVFFVARSPSVAGHTATTREHHTREGAGHQR